MPGSSCVVIADAGPLIAMSKIDGLEILRGLFGEVWITEQIRDEVLPGSDFPGKGAIVAAIDQGWLRLAAAVLSPPKLMNPGIDAGEASAIALALSLPGCLLVMDDRAGRAEAKASGLAVIGTAAAVGLAKERGLIESAGEVLRAMVGRGYYIHEDVIAVILREVGESG